jgi:carbonic anhydrase
MTEKFGAYNTVPTGITAQFGLSGGNVSIARIERLDTHLYLSSAVLAVTLLSTLLASGQEHKSGHWSYDGNEGPSHWGDLNPYFAPCKNGHRQSPIDIRNPQKADLPPIRFDYKPSPLHIIDNGHTIMINNAPGSSFRVGDKQYALKQFHFHRPSEEKINGKTYDMVMHLVHADQDGNLAVVAILLESGKNNPLIQELWNNFPKEKEKEERLDTITINVANLLPADLGYYTFSGSLTTPPCSENVTWFVLKQPITVTGEEIEQFTKLYRHDARPTQPLYDRVVLESR